MKMITTLAAANDKKNKVRSILVMAAVFFTTLLLIVIATCGYGMLQSQKANAGRFYGTYYGAYTGVGEDQLARMEQRGEFQKIGAMATVGEVENRADISLIYSDSNVLEMTNQKRNLDQGSFPEKENEITASPDFFRQLGYDSVKPGDRITLNSRENMSQKYKEREFVVSGVLKDYESNIKGTSFYGLVSRAYYNSVIPDDSHVYTAYFQLSDSVSISYDTAEETMKDLAQQCDIDPEGVSINDYYLMWKLDPGIENITICAGIALLVILFSVVVIYHIFQVGIAQKVQEYGKIKALGATRRQMKKLVFREGMLLALTAAPFGVIAGYGIGSALTRVLMMESSSAQPGMPPLEMVSCFNLPLLIFCGALSLASVWIALKRPMRIVAKISPVEAMRYQENSSPKKMRRSGKALSVWGLTKSNLTAYRKRTLKTILAMGLSCVLFVALSSFAGNIDNEYNARKEVEHGQFVLSLDYSMNDTAYPENNLDNILRHNPLGQETIEKIKKMDGVTDVTSRKYLYMTVGNHTHSVLVLDREDFEKQAGEGGILGDMDYEKASRENGIFYGWSSFIEDSGYHTGQKISANLEDGSTNKDYEAVIMGSFGNLDADWAITEDTYHKLGLENVNANGTIWVDCSQEDLDKVASSLENLTDENDHISMDSYENQLNISRMSSRALQFAVYAFMAVIGIISFMNMANTMIISIITRKQELGILQAIGMTSGQLNRMLQMEGLFFSIGTLLVSFVIGIPAGYAIFHYAKTHSYFGMNIYHFPWIQILAMTIVVIALQLILSWLLSRNVKKESIVERIRYQG